MASKTTLTDCQLYAFIELYRQHECIWNVQDPKYHDRNVAREAYIDIARAMNMTEDEVKKKVRSLRTQYVQKLNQYTSQIKSGAAADDVQLPTWKFFQPLHFLKPFVILKNGRDNLSSQVQPQSPHVPLEIASQANESQEEEQEEQSQSQGDLGLLMHRVGMGVTARPSAQRPRSAPLLEGTPSTSESERVGPSSIAAHPRRHSAPDHQESDYSAPGPQNGMSQNTSTSRRILDTAVHQFEGQAPDMYSPPSKRRKQDPTEEALRVLHSIANRRHETRPVDPEVAENEHFFKMMAYKVSKLPTDVQESLRFQMHKLVYEEQRKLSQ